MSTPDYDERKKISSGPRVNLACERCRKRHIRCDGQETCSNCLKMKTHCVYIEGDKKIVVSLKHIRDLRDENERLKAMLGTSSRQTSRVPPISNGSSPGLSGLGPTLKKARTDSSNLVEPAVRLLTIRDPSLRFPLTRSSGKRPYEGASSLSIVSSELRSVFSHGSNVEVDIVPIQKKRSPTIHLTRLELNFSVQVSRMFHRETTVDFILPSYDWAQMCQTEFDTFLGGCFYFYNSQQFKSRLAESYGSDTTGETSLSKVFWYAQLLLVLGVGEIYVASTRAVAAASSHPPSTPISREFPGMYYFNKAAALIAITFNEMEFLETSVQMVEVLLLYAYFHQLIDRHTEFYVIAGLCLRNAFILGMHADARADSLDVHELEHRRRLWWTILYVDRYISAKAGLPLSISEGSITTERPREMTGSGPVYGQFPSSVYLNSFIEISEITSSALSLLYQRAPEGTNINVVSIISDIMNRLHEWRQKWPPDLKVDWSDKHFYISRTALNILSEYYQCINLTVRPLLFHFVQKRINSDSQITLSAYSQGIVNLLNASLSASVQTIHGLHYIFTKNLFATFGYLDREYLFAAASTLELFIVAFGACEAACPYMERALELLEFSSRCGNANSNARKLQLLNLVRSFENLDPRCSHTKDYYTQVIKDFRQFGDISLTSSTSKVKGADDSHLVTGLTSQALTYGILEGSAAFTDGLYNGERELWLEIAEQATWLGNPEDEYRGPFSDVTSAWEWPNEATS
jgi:proline utilization trans-activator